MNLLGAKSRVGVSGVHKCSKFGKNFRFNLILFNFRYLNEKDTMSLSLLTTFLVYNNL